MAVSGILGKKVGMTQLFDDKGDVHPVTVLQAGPCFVTQRKTVAKDGYDAAQIGLVEFVKESRLTQPMKGHFAKHNLPPMRFLREVPIIVDADNQDGAKVGDKVLVDIFDGDKFVDVVATSKGRGFAGVVKRHKFAGGAASHGSMFQITGSIGSSAFPSRVFKGMRMSGHMGVDRVTVRNLRVLGVDKDENLLVVEGGGCRRAAGVAGCGQDWDPAGRGGGGAGAEGGWCGDREGKKAARRGGGISGPRALHY